MPSSTRRGGRFDGTWKDLNSPVGRAGLAVMPVPFGYRRFWIDFSGSGFTSGLLGFRWPLLRFRSPLGTPQKEPTSRSFTCLNWCWRRKAQLRFR